MSEYGETVAKFTAYADSVIAELHEQEVKQVEGQLRALGWEKVVRCRDCKFASEMENGKFDCTGVLTTSWDYYDDEPQFNLVEPSGFCAWGERRES